jgi:hypothetical protein
MKKRWLSGIVAAIGLCGVAFGVVALEPLYQPLAGIASGTSQAPTISCGVKCNGVWVHVNTCSSLQTCCGWHCCACGTSSATCCHPGQHCSWNGVGAPPAIYCIDNEN